MLHDLVPSCLTSLIFLSCTCNVPCSFPYGAFPYAISLFRALSFSLCLVSTLYSRDPRASAPGKKASPDQHMSSWGYVFLLYAGFPGSSNGKESACNAGDLSLIPGLGKSPGEGNDYSLQYSCLGNPIDRGAWRLQSIGVAKSWTRLSN